MRIAFHDQQNFVLENEQIVNSPADLVYVIKEDLGTKVMALAYIENGQYKWVSADGVTLIEKEGRIVKTLSSSDNLDFISPLSIDPLSNIDNINTESVWLRSIDFNSKYFGVEITSRFNVVGPSYLWVQDREIDTVLIEEYVNIVESDTHQFSDKDWVNQFWLNKNTGKVLRSRQKILPNGPYFDMLYVSRALRL